MEIGPRHYIAGPDLQTHAAEAAWKEDHRRLPNGDAFRRTLGLACPLAAIV